MEAVIPIRGPLNVGEDVVLESYPELESLLQEIQDRG